MKCKDHPFYPSKYCWGCQSRPKPCAVCGKKTSELMDVEAAVSAGEEYVQIEVCAGCVERLMSIDNKTPLSSYDGKLAIYRVRAPEVLK